MLRKDIVFDSLKNYTNQVTIEMIRNGYNGVSTNELVETLDINRANCSRELNQLYNDDVLVKITGKPVRFFPVSHLEALMHSKVLVKEASSLRDVIESSVSTLSDFDTVIGSTGSLSMAINQAKAAMIYPPFGLHTLITGETGIGKTMFVELMFNYAKEFGVLNKEARLVVFNCAEYADNPQLLVSELFGYAKGSFTGADSNKEGLVSHADKGILFLDEIHRLPAEGQEMLFQLMDSGKYRKLGDSSRDYKADVLIVGATTENVESNLLLTFMRRIPMLITLPNLDQRPMKEHLDLIHLFFEAEQKKINKSIHVEKKVIESLLQYRYPGNIGQLKTEVQLMCARAFLEAVKSKELELKVTKKLLPQYLLANTYGLKEQYIAVDTLLKVYDTNIIYDGNDAFRNTTSDEMHQNSINESMGIEEIKTYIQEMILTSNSNRNGLKKNTEEIFKVIKPEIYYSVTDALGLAQSRLKCTFQNQTYVAFSLHVQSIIERGLETKVFYNVSEDIKVTHREEYQAAKLVMSYLSEKLKYDFAAEEELLTTLFLTTSSEKSEEHIGLLIIAHGNGVAKNMAHVANTLLETDHARSLDMGLDETVESFYERFEREAHVANDGKGILILADMGSLTKFGQQFTNNTGIPTETVSFLSTPLVLEALRKVIFSTTTLQSAKTELLETISNSLKDISYVTEKGSNVIPSDKAAAVIVTCITGEGAAIALKNYIQDSLLLVDKMNVEFVTTNKVNFDPSICERYEIYAVAGAEDLRLENVPYISTEEVILGNGLKTLEFLLTKENSKRNYIPIQHKETMIRILKETLDFLDAERIFASVQESFEEIHSNYAIDDYGRININYMLHVPNAVERMIRIETLPYDDIATRIESSSELYSIIKASLRNIEESYRIDISDIEIGYMMDLFEND